MGALADMPTNLALDDDLLAEALRLGGHRSKRETVNEALSEYIARRKRSEAIRAFGTFTFDPGYDYKRERRRR
jgi:Arc/MetJ family transcription regulator